MQKRNSGTEKTALANKTNYKENLFCTPFTTYSQKTQQAIFLQRPEPTHGAVETAAFMPMTAVKLVWQSTQHTGLIANK